MLRYKEIVKTAVNEPKRRENTLVKSYESEHFLVSAVFDFHEEDITHLPEEMYQYLKETPIEERTPDKPIRYFSVDVAVRIPAYVNAICGRFDHFKMQMDYSFGDSMRDSKQDVLAEELMQIEAIIKENWEKFINFGNTEDLGGAQA